MNKYIWYLGSLILGLFLVPTASSQASVLYSQAIQLSPGWNIVSTPKILESHNFSSPETSNNFDIYTLDPSKTSGWATLADLGQTEFTPLYGYFINNKTGANQTLTFNYKGDTTPNQRLFERVFSTTGWYSFGVANPSYALTTDAPKYDKNSESYISNQNQILSSLTVGSLTSYDSVIDFTNASNNINSLALTDPWKAATKSDIFSLNSFRETKGYAIYMKSPGGLYSGFQNNNVPKCSDGVDNDGDNLADMNDPGCVSLSDNDENDNPTATLQLSINSSSPKNQGVIAGEGSGDNELDKVTALVFDVKAQNDAIQINDINIEVVKSGSGSAVASMAYIYEGSTELYSASIGNGVASFDNLGYMIPKDTTKTLIVKIDIRNANSEIANFVASASSTGIIAENPNGNLLTSKIGAAIGNQIDVRNVGLEIALVSKTTNSTAPQSSGTNSSTSTLTATFNVKLKAVGNDVVLGTVASGTPVFDPATSFQLFKNGIASDISTGATTTSFTIPSTCTAFGTNSCTLAEGSEVTIPVTFQISGRTAAGTPVASGLYSVELQKVNWGNGNYSDFMDGQQDWKTSDVSFP